MNSFYYQKISTEVGALHLVTTDKGLSILCFDCNWGKNIKKIKIPLIKEQTSLHLKVQKQLQEYMQGQRKIFDILLDPIGTTFQKSVWNALLQIPYGETITYGDQAQAIGNKKAVRAVGLANGKNPIAIIVPCHRVIGKNGTLTGYAGGLSLKQKLLQIENKQMTYLL